MSVFSSMRYLLGDPSSLGNLYAALAFLPLGLFFDFMDGKVARWRKKSSMMGQELDSLADLVRAGPFPSHPTRRSPLPSSLPPPPFVPSHPSASHCDKTVYTPVLPRTNTAARVQISFGLAPAVVAFAIGLRTPLDHVCLAFFVLCGLTRLARFNVTATSIPKDASGKAQYFEGTPIPTSLGLDAMMAYWVYSGWIGHSAVPGGVWFSGSILEVHPIVLVFMLHGCLMTSKTIHIPKP